MATSSTNRPAGMLDWLNTLSDQARLRLLAALDSESELSVGEMATALQTPQSTVSRHLKVLSEGGWVTARTAGTASLYRLAVDDMPKAASDLWRLALAETASSPTFADDRARLAEVVKERRMNSADFFGRIGAEWGALRSELFGNPFTAEALLSLIDPNLTVADLGCGSGDASAMLAPLVKSIVAVDRETTMIEAARKRLAEHANITFKTGELEDLPIESTSVDVAIVMLVLHHVPNPIEAIRELHRILKPGGRALIVDMVGHDRETYRQTMGHQHLGFDELQIEAWVKDVMFTSYSYRRLTPDKSGKGPGLFAAMLARAL